MKYFIFFLYLLTAVFAFGQSTTSLKTNKVVIGAPTAVDKSIEFNVGTANNGKIKMNATTSRLQFANDGTNFKDIGSGSGGSGINMIDNYGFETGITDGWTSSGGTFAAVTSGGNLLYQLGSASFDASATSQYFQTSALTLPEILKGRDCLAKIDYKGGDANLTLTVVDGADAQVVPLANSNVLNSNTGVKTAKLYFTCPSSGSVKLKVVSTADASIAYFDQAYIGETDSKAISVVGSWQAYTSGCSGSWVANTTYDCKKRRVGENYEYRIKVGTVGPPTSTSLLLNIPDTIDTSKLISTNIETIVGSIKINDSATAVYHGDIRYLTTTSVSLINLGSAGSYLNSPTPVDQATPITFGNGDYIEASFTVPIVGLSSSENSINSKCLSDIACENVFTARISNTGVVTQENLDWINGNTSISGGQQTITFNSGIFTEPPNCFTSTETGYGVNVTGVGVASASSVGTRSYNTTNNAESLSHFSITCVKTGADFKAKQTIQGFLASTVTSAANNMRIESLFVNSVCSASPCTIANQTGGFTSVTRTGTGQYVANITSGVFSTILHCGAQAQSAGGNPTYISSESDPALSTTYFKFRTIRRDTHLEADEKFSLFCIGIR